MIKRYKVKNPEEFTTVTYNGKPMEFLVAIGLVVDQKTIAENFSVVKDLSGAEILVKTGQGIVPSGEEFKIDPRPGGYTGIYKILNWDLQHSEEIK